MNLRFFLLPIRRKKTEKKSENRHFANKNLKAHAQYTFKLLALTSTPSPTCLNLLIGFLLSRRISIPKLSLRISQRNAAIQKGKQFTGFGLANGNAFFPAFFPALILGIPQLLPLVCPEHGFGYVLLLLHRGKIRNFYHSEQTVKHIPPELLRLLLMLVGVA
jgi:hypothetical protein